MPLSDVCKTKLPFCRICVRYLSPAEANRHDKHARAIKWPR